MRSGFGVNDRRVTRTADGRVTRIADGRGMCRKDGGVWVLHLQGSEEEMVRQHGELLKGEIRAGVLPFMARFLHLHMKEESAFFGKLSSNQGFF